MDPNSKNQKTTKAKRQQPVRNNGGLLKSGFQDVLFSRIGCPGDNAKLGIRPREYKALLRFNIK